MPFVTWRAYEGAETDLFYYHYLPIVYVALWPRALTFDVEQHLHPSYIRISERWVLGGVPSSMILFRGDHSSVQGAMLAAGGQEEFISGLEAGAKMTV